jgi:hypothetical protein
MQSPAKIAKNKIEGMTGKPDVTQPARGNVRIGDNPTDETSLAASAGGMLISTEFSFDDW